MKLQQVSVFLENKPGQLRGACQTLADAQLNILTLTLADTREFGILRLLLPEWERAAAALQAAGFVTAVNEVLALEVADRPGGLAEVLAVLDAAGVNVEYMYAFASARGDRAILIFRFDNPDAAIARLTERGVSVLDGGTLYVRAEK